MLDDYVVITKVSGIKASSTFHSAVYVLTERQSRIVISVLTILFNVSHVKQWGALFV